MDIIKKSQYKKTAIGLLPIDWKVLKAGDIFSNHTNKKHDGNLEVLSATQDRGIIPRNKLDIEIKYDKNSLKNYKKVEPGDFVISLRSFQGGIEYSDYEGIVSPAYTVLKNKIEIDEGFYKYLFKKEDFINRLNSVIYGIRDGKQISYSDFKDLKLQYPPIGEQKRIATILSTWDKAIELKEILIEQKKEQKKGLMQKLLTGEVRLPGFKDSWKSYSIEELAEYFTDGDWIEAPYLTSEGVLLIQTGNIGIGEYIEKNMKFISEKSFEELKCTEVKPGDILICRLADPIGRSCIVPDFQIKMITAVDVAILRVNKEIANNEYLNYVLNLPKTLREMDSLGAGSTRKRISRKNLGKVKLNIPNLEEQQAIKNILTKIDSNINLLEKELHEIKEQKKGLMQILLTGKVRVQV